MIKNKEKMSERQDSVRRASIGCLLKPSGAKTNQCGIAGTGLRQVKIVGKWQITMISVRMLIIGSIQRIYN